MNSSTGNFIRLAKHAVKFRMFLFWKLPAAFFSGVRIKEIDETRTIVSVPYKWLTQNPFSSTYFASLAMAAELSTGVLGMMHVYKRMPAVSMLITNMEATYFKKSTGKTFFICEQGKQIRDIVEQSIITGQPHSIIVKSTGTNKNGELIATFLFTWSFKVKAG
jgi:hypothetical protein